jgi:hypothetical protein
MTTENIIIAYPTTTEQVNALKAVVKALKIKFKETKQEKPYNPEFVAKIEKSRQDYKDGKGTVMTVEELNELWK